MDDGKVLPPSFQDNIPEYESDGNGGVRARIPVIAKQEDETLYVECGCHSMDHLTRLWFDSDDEEFYFEYRLDEFPGKYLTTTSKPGQSWFWFQVRIKANWVKRYLANLRNALVGRKQYFVGQAVIGSTEAMNVARFINRKLKVPTEQR